MLEIKDSYYYPEDDDRFVMLKQLTEKLLQMWLEQPVEISSMNFRKQYNDFTPDKEIELLLTPPTEELVSTLELLTMKYNIRIVKEEKAINLIVPLTHSNSIFGGI